MKILDDIAKKLSKKQITEIYENKMNKKYKNKFLLEDLEDEEDDDENYNMHKITIYKEDLEELGKPITIEQFIKYYLIPNKFMNFKNDSTVITLYIHNNNLNEFQDILLNLGFSDKDVDVILGFKDADSYYEDEDEEDEDDNNPYGNEGYKDYDEDDNENLPSYDEEDNQYNKDEEDYRYNSYEKGEDDEYYKNEDNQEYY